jgi:HlyD family secretion protein
MKKKIIIGIVVIAISASVGIYLWKTANGKDPNLTTVGQVKRYIKAERGDLNVTVAANGVVQPINSVEIKSKASGQIMQLTFEEGQTVEKDQLLVLLDQTTAINDNEQAKADLEVSNANAEQAANTWKRTQDLYSKQMVSDQERDQAKVDFVRTKAQVIKSKAALSSTEDRLRDTRVLSPISGIILSKSVELGQIISSGVSNVGGGTLIASIADMKEVHVEAYVDEVDIGRVQVGQQVKIIADAYPEDTFMGQVVRIAPLGKTTQNVTTFTVVILVQNLGGKLKAGMSTSVDIEIFNKQNVVLVSNEALYDTRTPAGKQLFDDYRQAHRDSTVTAKRDGQAKMDSSGAKPGAKSEEIDFSTMSREEIRARMDKMTPEERDKFREKMRQRFMSGGATGRPGGEGRSRRQTGDANKSEEKQRIVVVKEGGQYVPRLIKVGATNFDVSEVVDGLKEGDELEITTISRAKIAADQMNQRMRASSTLSGGGMGGGRH